MWHLLSIESFTILFFFFLMGVHKMLLYKDVQLYVECFIYLDE